MAQHPRSPIVDRLSRLFLLFPFYTRTTVIIVERRVSINFESLISIVVPTITLRFVFERSNKVATERCTSHFHPCTALCRVTRQIQHEREPRILQVPRITRRWSKSRKRVVDDIDEISNRDNARCPFMREHVGRANSNLGYDCLVPFSSLHLITQSFRRIRTIRRRLRASSVGIRLSVARNTPQWSADVTSLTFTDTDGFCHSPPP